MNALELHGWQSKADDIERPDQLVFDLDPGENLPWARVAEGARDVRAALKSHGLESFVKTSGGKGLHVVAPIRPKKDWGTIKAFCHAVAQEMETSAPMKYVSNMSKAKRAGRIFIDYLRNQRGATSVLPFSTRARAGATVSMPIEWEAVGRTRADSFHLANAVAHLKRRKTDPWAHFSRVKQSI
jgi:bifunctional non-homologous end joining protein LigD